MSDRIDSLVFPIMQCKDFINNKGNYVRNWAWKEGWIKSQPIPYIFCGFISVCCSEINHSTRSKSPFRRVMIEQQFWFWKKQVHRQLLSIWDKILLKSVAISKLLSSAKYHKVVIMQLRLVIPQGFSDCLWNWNLICMYCDLFWKSRVS